MERMVCMLCRRPTFGNCEYRVEHAWRKMRCAALPAQCSAASASFHLTLLSLVSLLPASELALGKPGGVLTMQRYLIWTMGRQATAVRQCLGSSIERMELKTEMDTPSTSECAQQPRI
eukprot:scaffold7071_cov260-Pinguiococcus_pyrenoidosus.AAC.10